MIFEDLRSIQREHGYLPDDRLKDLSYRIDVPLHRIEGLASFYPHLFRIPQAKVNVGICTDLVCHLHQAEKLTASASKRAQASPPGSVSVREVSCLGRCDAAPAIAVNDVIFENVDAASTERLLLQALNDLPFPIEYAAAPRQLLQSDPYSQVRQPAIPKYTALRQLLASRNVEQALSELGNSGLAGMGGAGFAAHTKWDLVRNAKSKEKYVICNADESEPGTIKDGFIMRHLPYLVVEGLIIAALMTGAQKGYIYIRHEYEIQAKRLQEEIQYCRDNGLLGKSVLENGQALDLEIFVSPGGYICGEGSALLEAIEGKRAEPRIRPPNSATNGLWQKPTAVNNVETLAMVPQILLNGAAWFRAQGEAGASGLKFVSVTGDVQRPGVFEIPMGTPASEVVELAGGAHPGRKLKAFAPSGAASGYLPASLLSLRLDFKSMAAAGTMLGSGAMVVLDDRRCMLDMALNSLRFFRNESCGKCVPCRIGSQKMVDIVEQWVRGTSNTHDREAVAELSETLRLTSICGLGQFIPYSIETVTRYFSEEISAHLEGGHCPAGVCEIGKAAR